MPAQGRLGDKASIQADSHGCPGCPHTGTGPGIAGSPNVNVNGRPALRKDDTGMHAACCAGNTWTAKEGAPHVNINGKAAYRVDDPATHCGGDGKLAEGSPDVNVGNGGGGGQAQNSGDRATLVITEVRGLYRPGFDDGTGKRCGYELHYKSADNLGRVFINTIPRAGDNWRGTWQKDKQYIELGAEITVWSSSGSSNPPSNLSVEWEWSDPDNNNLGQCDHQGGGPDAKFEAIGSYSLTPGADNHKCETVATEHDGGFRSEVKLHLTNVGGDNFVVRARVKQQANLSSGGWDTTGTMTMWKRIDVEYGKLNGAPELPIDRVPPCFEPAFIQMDFVPNPEFAQQVSSDWQRDYLARNYSDAVTRRRQIVEGAAFRNRDRPGWFLLVSAKGHSEDQGRTSAPIVYSGPAHIRRAGDVVTLDIDLVRGVLAGGEPVHVRIFDPQGVANFPMDPSSADFRVLPNSYVSWFVPPFDLDGSTRAIVNGTTYDGRAEDVVDEFYPTHVTHVNHRSPRGQAPSGVNGYGFTDGQEVKVVVYRNGALERGGATPELQHGNSYYFAGRTIVFNATTVKRPRAQLRVAGTWNVGDWIEITVGPGTPVRYTVTNNPDVNIVTHGVFDALRSQASDRVRVLRDFYDEILVEWLVRGENDQHTVSAATSSPSGIIGFDRSRFGGGGPDVEKAVRFIVHELCHGFGMPHICGFPTDDGGTCIMSYGYNVWVYERGTREPRPFDEGRPTTQFCAMHLQALRYVHLEDNPRIWSW